MGFGLFFRADSQCKSARGTPGYAACRPPREGLSVRPFHAMGDGAVGRPGGSSTETRPPYPLRGSMGGPQVAGGDPRPDVSSRQRRTYTEHAKAQGVQPYAEQPPCPAHRPRPRASAGMGAQRPPPPPATGARRWGCRRPAAPPQGAPEARQGVVVPPTPTAERVIDGGLAR